MKRTPPTQLNGVLVWIKPTNMLIAYTFTAVDGKSSWAISPCRLAIMCSYTDLATGFDNEAAATNPLDMPFTL